MKELGTPPNNFTPSQPHEYFIVGNETGLQGRLIEHLAQSMGPMFDSLKLGISLADFHVGQTIDQTIAERAEKASKGKEPAKQHTEDEEQKGGGYNVPDFVLLRDDVYTFCVMFEVKTFLDVRAQQEPIGGTVPHCQIRYVSLWGKHPDEKLTFVGQLARYMDDARCRFGALTTHEKMWFVRRASPDTFAVSNGIFAGQTATSEVPSLRQCLLYISWLASDKKGAFSPGVFGDKLVSNIGR